MILIYEDSGSSAFDINNPGRVVKQYLPTEKVGNVSAKDYMKFEKRQDAEIVYMTADEYINRCIKDIFGMSYDKVVTDAVDFDKVDKYANLMKHGTTFPIGYLNYADRQQEGRHRALAFKQAFGKDAKMPVLIINPTATYSVTLDEIMDYCRRKWGEYADHFFEGVASNIGYSDYEIDEYLGRDTDVEFDVSDDELADMLDDEYNVE